MDYKLLARFCAILGLIFGVLLVYQPANAQSGACPPNATMDVTPGGSYPSNLLTCRYRTAVIMTISTNGEFPCDQMVRIGPYNSNFSNQLLETADPVVFVPASDYPLGQLASVSFIVFAIPVGTQAITHLSPPGLGIKDDVVIRIEYINEAGQVVSSANRSIASQPYLSTWFDSALGTRAYYKVYMINDVLLTTDDGYGGYVKIRLNGLTPSGVGTEIGPFGISSVRIGAYGAAMPQFCPYSNLQWPDPYLPSPTPMPTWTPNGTPYPTPNTTPLPTAVGGTPYPTPLSRPIEFPTLPAQPTPTPWPRLRMSNISWPAVNPPPVVFEGAVPTVDWGGADTGLNNLADGIESDWQGSTYFAGSTLDMDSSAATGGVGTPNELAAGLVENISLPIAYVKAMSSYMPNAWPFVLTLIGIAAWIVFNISAKFSLSIVAKLFELIRRLIELIPGM